jgi:S1-C subfamily serine protease
MIENEHGAGTQTLPRYTEDPSAPGPGSGPPRRGGSRKVLVLVGGGLAAVVVAGGVAVATLGSSTPPPAPAPRPAPPLTAPQIAAKDKPSTVEVVAYADPGSPLVQGDGGNNVLDSGSAWVYNARQGLIVTNAHVVGEAKTVKVGFNQTTLTDATIVGVDLKDDIAVLRVSPGQLPGLKTLPRANPSSVQQGEQAYALGFEGDGNSNFLNAPYQLTTGSVSAVSGVSVTVNVDPLGESNDNAGLFESGLIQTDAAINPGNSGGPLVDDHGRIIGMNSAASTSAHTQGYAIPIQKLDAIVPQLAQGQSLAFVGFDGIPLRPDVSDKWGIQGALILTSVTQGTPADQAGLTQALADATNNGALLLIYKINGQDITTEQEYVNALSQIQSGENFTVSLVGVDLQGNVVVKPVTKTLTAP